jgi:hypothetical protein
MALMTIDHRIKGPNSSPTLGVVPTGMFRLTVLGRNKFHGYSPWEHPRAIWRHVHRAFIQAHTVSDSSRENPRIFVTVAGFEIRYLEWP